MSFNNFSPITKLNASKIKWNIKVRAQAVWKGITRETKEFRGINMILVDDSRFRIHAFVSARFAHLFEKDLEEGQIYNISNFIVQEYTGVEFHRCVRFEKHIYFAEYTKLAKSLELGLRIPQCCFDFFDLKDLEKMECDKRFLCDVAGIVKDATELLDYVNDNQEQKKQKKFTITDGRSAVKVTFFDDFAENVENVLKKEQNYPIAIIIASAKIGRFLGELSLTNYPATRLYLNTNHDFVQNLKTRAKDPTFYKDMVVREDEHPEMMTVKDIKQLTDKYIAKKVVCGVTVKKVQEHLHWYDCICPKCNILLDKVNERFRCGKCGKYYPWPPKRFRVCLIGCDSTGGLAIMLGDREVRKLTGKTVFDITLDQAEGDEDKFPQVIKDFQNKYYKMVLKISAENVTKESDVYEAIDIANEGEENLSTEASLSISSPSAEDDNSVIQMEFNNTQTSMQMTPMVTPTVGKGSKNTKIRKTPESEDEVPDDMCISTFKNMTKKKDKMIDKKKSQKNTPPTGKSATKEQSLSFCGPQSSIENDHISLNKYQKNTKQKGKGRMQ
ncbi:DUF223 domain-containing protein [Heracleum sosnowskyi]|uniref:DUF223 domain-containing protein n=1 Tax=Heracleum sosnowskyi TaxID=360622 RepID=A0AAD8MUW3_9APIA|nr:DUF223 domain-containing protein [Heracleum sosnowskyi]